MAESNTKTSLWQKALAAVVVALALCASVIIIGWAIRASAENFKKVEELPGPRTLQSEACESVGGTLMGRGPLSGYECALDDGTVVNIEQRQRAIDSGEVEPPK